MTVSVPPVFSRFISIIHRRLAGPAVPADVRLRDAENAVMLPIARRYCLLIGAYYVFVIIERFRTEAGAALAILAALAIVNMAASLFFGTAYLRGAQAGQRASAAMLAVNLLLLANPVVFQLLHFTQGRLLYFYFLAMVFAVTGVRLRVIVPSVVATLVSGTAIAVAHYQVISRDAAGFGLLVIPVMVAISTGVRHTLFQAVQARVTAEVLREEAQVLADCDALTNLANRRSFFRAADTALAAAASGRPFVLALIDLDGFKPVNDTYGHSVGDELLITVAGRLREVCDGKGFPARMGGDEFAIILDGDLGEDDVREFGAILCEALREIYLLGTVAASISASVGFVRHSDGLTVSQLLERADYALYFAKQNLRGAPVVFNARHESEMRDFNQVDQTLRSSDLDKELSIVFQPQVDITENRTVGFEALARWNSAKLGAVRPDVFIKAAERSGLITDITLRLINKTLEQITDWPQDMRVSFNLSARDLRSAISLNNICTAVRNSGIDPTRIEFEITETAMLTDFAQACDALMVLKRLGCRIAVDDFGSGYSSFSYIHQLPVDKIKIDRSFVTQLVKHASAVKIIKTIVDLCRNLHLDCVIEGVETQAEMAKLAQVRARYIQGYLFARPMPALAAQ
ncbi:MAG: EAL domain-containing protein [Asticcacaulis sp.]|nr:EAL domain-containing protein [Asticcacaulis sp.]